MGVKDRSVQFNQTADDPLQVFGAFTQRDFVCSGLGVASQTEFGFPKKLRLITVHSSVVWGWGGQLPFHRQV